MRLNDLKGNMFYEALDKARDEINDYNIDNGFRKRVTNGDPEVSELADAGEYIINKNGKLEAHFPKLPDFFN